jgi:hypothetical protein
MRFFRRVRSTSTAGTTGLERETRMVVRAGTETALKGMPPTPISE